MKMYKTIFTIGLLVIIVPFLGLPPAFKPIPSVVLGLFLIVISALMKIENLRKENLDFPQEKNEQISPSQENIPEISQVESNLDDQTPKTE